MIQYSKFFDGIVRIVLLFFIFLQIPSGSFAFAEVVTISGKIQKITPLDGGQFELTVKTNSGSSKFVVDSSTLIQATVPVKEVKEGQKIMMLPKAEIKGMKGLKGIKAPFGNVSPVGKKMLGLPDIPAVPSIPEVPAVPKVPDIPKIPKTSQAAGKPEALAQAGGAAPALGLNEQTKPKQEEAEIPELPKDASFSALNPSALSQPMPEEAQAKKVVELRATAEGINLKLAGETGEEEELTLSPDQKVIQFLTVDDLRRNMNVSLEIAGGPNGNSVQRITVA